MKQSHFTPTQTAIILARYPHELTSVIAAEIGCTVRALYHKAHQMGLKKTPEYLASNTAGRTNGSQGQDTRFKKGNISWNKDKKGLMLGGEKGWFKPGEAPPNRLPVGHIRINSDGYQDIKTAEGARKWVNLHRWNWKQAHGSYPPKGMALIFKDGDRMNCDLSNLELISRHDLMKKNSVHNLPKDLALIVQLKGALQRQINAKQSDI